ncbi:MAG: chemotaxis protein CheW [Rhodospirillaceae bacterium]
MTVTAPALRPSATAKPAARRQLTDIDTPSTTAIYGDHGRQFMVFAVGAQEYAIDVMVVREIRGWTQESKLPNLPPHIRGVINLRGLVIPILDLRTRFGFESGEVGSRNVVIIMQVAERTVGVLVDAITEILTIASDQIMPVPEMGAAGPETRFLTGVHVIDERLLALLDVELLILGHHIDLEEVLPV